MNEHILAALDKVAMIFGHITSVVPAAAPMGRFVVMLKDDLDKARAAVDVADVTVDHVFDPAEEPPPPAEFVDELPGEPEPHHEESQVPDVVPVSATDVAPMRATDVVPPKK